MLALIFFVMHLILGEGKGWYSFPAIFQDTSKIREVTMIINPATLSQPGDFIVARDVYIKDYHTWVKTSLDSINKKRDYKIDEYVLIRANPFLLDSLRHSDYYYLKEKGIKSLDPKECLLVAKGSRVKIPDEEHAAILYRDLENTRLDINIPEYLIRVYQYEKVVDSFFVRVGKNAKKYLAMAGRVIDLRTKTGEGQIVAIQKNPVFINPVDNKRYKGTYRDDGVLTSLPNIPWLETEINGQRNGQMWHPTTNLGTLKKPVSNGCIGLRESDAWALFFYAPVGTRVKIRYDLIVTDKNGKEVQLDDIYKRNKKNDTKSRLVMTGKSYTTLCFCGTHE